MLNEAKTIKGFRLGVVCQISHLYQLRNDNPIVRRNVRAISKGERCHDLSGHANYGSVLVIVSLKSLVRLENRKDRDGVQACGFLEGAV